MKEYKKLFSYPETFEDIEVSQEIIETNRKDFDYTYYSICIEGLIYYKTLQDGIDYLTILKDKYYEWLIGNYDIDVLIEERNQLNQNTLYQSYDIEITDEGEIGCVIYLYAPSFSVLYQTYEWLDGVIKQLKTINI